MCVDRRVGEDLVLNKTYIPGLMLDSEDTGELISSEKLRIKKSLKNMYADNCFKYHEREVRVAITANIGEIVSVRGW